MMINIPCVIVLIVFAAMGSVRAQDIEPQYIPRPSTTEGPEKEGAVTATENPITTTEADDTTTDVISTTTNVIAKDDTTTYIAPTEAEDTSTETTRTTTDVIPTNVPAATTIRPEKAPTPRPEQTPSFGGPVLNCRIMLISGTPYYNWILGVAIVPKTCSYCCAVACIQKCIEIEPFYCIG